MAPAGADEEPAVIVYTSGTSATPRGAILTHRAVLAAQHNLLVATGKQPDALPADWRGDIQLQTIPLFHIGGFPQLISAFLTGSRMVFCANRFNPAEILDVIEKESIARWGAIPTMLSRVLDEPVGARDLDSLKAIGLGGAPVSPDLMDRARERFPNLRRGAGNVYGMSEAGGALAMAPGRDPDRPRGSSGRPLPLVELRIAEDGEILARTPGQMSGYWGRPGESPIDDEGWLHTGDLGRIDADGYLFVTGRSKDMIIRGGENISPVQVEAALLRHPGVREAAVVGLPDEDLGEVVGAVVVPHDPSVSSDELRAFLRGQLASVAIPSLWWIRSVELPTNQTGKVLKRELVAAWPKRLSGSAHAT